MVVNFEPWMRFDKCSGTLYISIIKNANAWALAFYTTIYTDLK